MPDGVTTINRGAFLNCTALTSIYLSDTVTTVGKDVFNGCTALTINAAAASKPAGWDETWNSSNRPVNWSYVPA
jgi:hypothetical protein